MSKLHVKLTISIDLFDLKGALIERVSLPLPNKEQDWIKMAPRSCHRKIPLNEIQHLVREELSEYTFPWMGRIFIKFLTRSIGFEEKAWIYHMWLRTRDGKKLRSQDLANALYDADPEKGGLDGWMRAQKAILSEEEYSRLKVGRIELVPLVKSITLVQEHEVHLDQLPPPKKYDI